MKEYEVTITFKTDYTGDRVFPLTYFNIYAQNELNAENEAINRFNKLRKDLICIPTNINASVTEVR